MTSKPHIIIFNPDQWRGDVLGHMGNPAAVTPNLDRFVEEDAVSFSAAFCQNPVCTPSRCSFMSGWYPHVRGHRTMYHMLHPEQGEPNLLKILKDNGYFVWWGGKNDLTPGQDDISPYCDIRFQPEAEDFARWGLTPREGAHGGDLAWRGSEADDNFYSFFKGRLEKGDEDIYCDGDSAVVLGAVDFLRKYDGDQPLCIYLPLNYPHPPYCVEEPWFSLIDRAKLPRRAEHPQDWEGKPSILKGIWQHQRMQTWTEERWDELRATYYGMCARTDHQFGQVTAALRERGLYEDSAVFMFSDHGDFTGDYGLVEKTQNTFEDCLTRVPFIVKPPAKHSVTPGVSGALVELIDFTATVYDLTGIDPGYDHFGQSLLPVLAGESGEHRDAVFCEGGRRFGEVQAMERDSASSPQNNPTGLYTPRVRHQITDEGPYHSKAAMCRTRTHKYVRRLYEQDELYDLVRDPLEEHNLIDDPASREILTALKERILRWYMETCDVVPRQPDSR
ncbi:MAG: sulfatase-like hydrolase/transferase [Verrucomicrobia bacterium]|nr:sulfatase-like hydrolase/transferase [Verrucomicrobiota bacterium]MCH8527829.1 sulfatase-like hydrolase/transferase [Kiritimatiellia bacterium]